MKKYFSLNQLVLSFFLVGLILFFSGCSNREVVTQCLKGTPYGFWGGLWQGIIAPIDLIVSLFRDDVTVYATNNTGFWYAFGFVLGSGGWGFLGGHRASRRKKHV